MAEQHSTSDEAAILRELEARYPQLARASGRTLRAMWCDTCQAFQIMEVLEDGTRECVACRLHQERQRELQPPLMPLDVPDDASDS